MLFFTWLAKSISQSRYPTTNYFNNCRDVSHNEYYWNVNMILVDDQEKSKIQYFQET